MSEMLKGQVDDVLGKHLDPEQVPGFRIAELRADFLDLIREAEAAMKERCARVAEEEGQRPKERGGQPADWIRIRDRIRALEV